MSGKKSKLRKMYRLAKTQRRTTAIIIVAVVATIGVTLIFSSKAATPTASFEAESGTVISTAKTVNDSNASGGKAVQFVAASGGSGLKAVPVGLYTNNYDAASTVDHIFLNVNWPALEPTRGTYNWSSIDSQINAHPTLFYRIRVESGVAWGQNGWLCAVASSAGCIKVDHNKTGTSGYTPEFWTTAYLNEWQTFMTAFANHYESNNQVLDVVNGACETFTAEPFILGGTGPGSAADELYNAGLSVALDQNCIEKSSDIIATAMPRTRISLATFDGMQEPTGQSWPDEKVVLDYLSNKYGTRLLLQNDGIAPETTTCGSSQNLCYQQNRHSPGGYQMGCGSKTTNCTQAGVLDAIVSLGGCFAEHANWREVATAGKLHTYDNQLKAQPFCTDP